MRHTKWQTPISQFQKGCAFSFPYMPYTMMKNFIQIQRNLILSDSQKNRQLAHFFLLVVVIHSFIVTLYRFNFFSLNIYSRSTDLYWLSLCEPSHWRWFSFAFAAFCLYNMRSNSNSDQILNNQKYPNSRKWCLVESQPNSTLRLNKLMVSLTYLDVFLWCIL